MILSSYIDGTNVGASRVPGAPFVIFMLNGSFKKKYYILKFEPLGS